MKVKPKEVLLNLPVVLMFDDGDKIAEFASNINTLIHGKVRVKVEELGTLGGQYVGMFYLQRNGEFSELREQFMQMIEDEQVGVFLVSTEGVEFEDDERAEIYDPFFGDEIECECGHPYYRHFDSYEEMAPVGCKYCSKENCIRFRAKK